MSDELTSADAVIALFEEATEANLDAKCRRGSIDEIGAPGQLIATGDLHDNPMHFQRLVEIANLGDDPGDRPRKHLTLHELIHSDRLIDGMDFSYRTLARVARLKAKFPEYVHTLVANHEMAQMLNEHFSLVEA